MLNCKLLVVLNKELRNVTLTFKTLKIKKILEFSLIPIHILSLSNTQCVRNIVYNPLLRKLYLIPYA